MVYLWKPVYNSIYHVYTIKSHCVVLQWNFKLKVSGFCVIPAAVIHDGSLRPRTALAKAFAMHPAVAMKQLPHQDKRRRSVAGPPTRLQSSSAPASGSRDSLGLRLAPPGVTWRGLRLVTPGPSREALDDSRAFAPLGSACPDMSDP